MMRLQYPGASATLSGAKWCDLQAGFAGYDPIRQIERASIRQFLETHKQYLRGRVLDFGAGKEPYKDLIAGEYVPYEKDQQIPTGYFDAVLCTQVIQYLDNPGVWLRWGASAALKRGGYLVMTWPCCWDEVEISDLWRFTKYGIEKLLRDVGFVVVEHARRAEVAIDNFRFPLGYGLIAHR